jgi:hypothetical protein
MVKFSLPKEKTFSGPALIWKRILAFFIDMLLINLVVLFPFQSMLSELLPKELSFSQTFALLSSDSNFLSNLSVISIAMAILVMLYFIILENGPIHREVFIKNLCYKRQKRTKTLAGSHKKPVFCTGVSFGILNNN